MKPIAVIAKPVSALGLALIVIAPLLFAVGRMEAGLMNGLLLAGTVAWFVSAPFWVKTE
jgi:hypothetical protein